MGSTKKRSAKQDSTYFAILKRKAERDQRLGRTDGLTMKEVNQRFKQFQSAKESSMPDCSLTSDCPSIPRSYGGSSEDF